MIKYKIKHPEELHNIISKKCDQWQEDSRMIL